MKLVYLITLFLVSHLISLNANSLEDELANKTRWESVPLIDDATHNFLLIEMDFGKGKGLFMVDTGAAMSAFNKNAAERFGLKVVDAKGRARGIGGAFRKGKTVIPHLRSGPLDFEVTELKVLPIEVLEDKSSWGGHEVLGVLGSDLLSKFGMVLDVESATLFSPREGRRPLLAKAKESGLEALPFSPDSLIPVLAAKVGEQSINALLDTGASSILLDEKVRSKQGLPRYRSGQISGAGGAQEGGQTFIAKFELGGASFSNNGADLMDLSVFPGGIQALMGIDLMHRAKLYFDYSGKQVFFRGGRYAGDDTGVAGPFLLSKEKLTAKVGGAKTVAFGKVLGFSPKSTLKNQKGEVFKKFTFRFKVQHVLAGEGEPGENLEIEVAVPEADSDIESLKARAMAGDFKLVFVTDGKGPQRLDRTFYKSSSIRVAQIVGVRD